jgi:hypothetical protein
VKSGKFRPRETAIEEKEAFEGENEESSSDTDDESDPEVQSDEEAHRDATEEWENMRRMLEIDEDQTKITVQILERQQNSNQFRKVHKNIASDIEAKRFYLPARCSKTRGSNDSCCQRTVRQTGFWSENGYTCW